MLKVRIIAVGGMKERDLEESCAEYQKRLSAFCSPEITELKEARLPDAPSAKEIAAALSEEGERIIAAIPPRSFTVVATPEGRSLSSEELAARIEAESLTHPSLCFIIGSSHGLSPEVKRRADLLLSFSAMTFPHRLFRLMLLEQIYRSFTIIKGTGYHK